MLQNKKILIGGCGSIAAYKGAFLIRELIKSGAEVKVIMTPSAHDFISALTLSTLSKNPTLTKFENGNKGEWNNHVELGLWADAILIAPETANTLAKLANGICDNLLSAVYLSARCPAIHCPAMDLDMYRHPTTQKNIEQLKSFGNHVIDAEEGELASGLQGQGRMAEPEHIIEYLQDFFTKKKILSGKRFLVTAGPTQEAIDPVRFVSNHSSGKMGYAIAHELARQGAKVDLISGPSLEVIQGKNIKLTKVKTAEEMFEASKKVFPKVDGSVFSAAVADYRPKTPATQKIKKSGEKRSVDFIKNPDIAFELGKLKKQGQIHIGFALETENEVNNATQKLQNKNFDMIILNSLNDSGAGFQTDTNKISIIAQNKITNFELKSKTEVAKDIVAQLSAFYENA